jgi:hypothetical protein
LLRGEKKKQMSNDYVQTRQKTIVNIYLHAIQSCLLEAVLLAFATCEFPLRGNWRNAAFED